MSPVHVSKFLAFGKRKTELTGNDNFLLFAANGKTETANFRLFATKGNGKRKFVFIGQQTINSNRRLLLQQV
jgi:hypothetical protein